MGLDMYLKCNSRTLAHEVFDKQVAAGYEDAGSFHRPHGIICYWRKANAIHNWFVENVQNGEDDCGTYEVNLEQLKELLDTCREVRSSSVMKPARLLTGISYSRESGHVKHYVDGHVLADPSCAKRLLPTCEGFFFGSAEYDDYYIEELDKTILVLETILSRVEGDADYPWCGYIPEEPDWNVSFSYHASW